MARSHNFENSQNRNHVSHQQSPQQLRLPPSAEQQKYARLESLLLQTLALAGDIARTKNAPESHTTDASRPARRQADYIILRKTFRTPDRPSESANDHPGTNKTSSDASSAAISHPRSEATSPGPIHPAEDSEPGDNGSAVTSPPSPIQEPFSPRTLARSLDAVVEGGRPPGGFGGSEDEEEAALLPSGLDEGVGTTGLMTPISSVAVSPPPPTPASVPVRSASRSSSAWGGPIREEEDEEGADEGEEVLENDDEDSERHPQACGVFPRWWQVRIAPLGFDNTFEHDSAESTSASTSFSVTPATSAIMKLEAVFPCQDLMSNGINSHDAAAAPTRSGEGSYIVIARQPILQDPAEELEVVGD